MSIITRYVFRQALGALALILSTLTGIVWVALALKELDIVTSSGQDTWTFVAITTLAVPSLLGFVAPAALLIATAHVLNRLNGDSELIVLTASGATLWWIARPLLLLAALVTISLAALNFYVMPASLRLANDLIIQVRSDLISKVLTPGSFGTPERDVTVHVRDRGENGDLLGVLFHDARKPDQLLTLVADRGLIGKEDGRPYLVLADGFVTHQSEVVAAARLVQFDRYVVELDSLERQVASFSWRPRQRYLDELLWPEADDPQFKAGPGKFRAEIHERFSSLLYPVMFVVILVAAVGQAQSTRTNRGAALITACLVAVILRLIGLAANNLVAASEAAVPLLYAVPLAGVVGSVAFMRWKSIPRAPSARLRAWKLVLDERLSAIGSTVVRRGKATPAAPSAG
ncbi:MAG: LptF/LptG family permease [Hyphomicrobiaceae bacterium]